MAAFKEQMAAKDKSTRNFCDYVLDRQRMTDGKSEVIVPSGFSHAVSNGSEVILSNDPISTTGTGYHELKKVE